MEKNEVQAILEGQIMNYQEGLLGGAKLAAKRFGSNIAAAVSNVKEDYRKGSKQEDIKKMMDLAKKYGYRCITDTEYAELTSTSKKKK